MLKKLDFTDKHLSAICSAAEISGIAAFGVACGVMYHAQMILAGPAGAAVAGVVAYLLAYWIHTGANDRMGSDEDYAEGFSAAKRKLIDAGWRQAAAPEQPESVLPSDLADDMEAMAENIEEGQRFFRAALEHNAGVRRHLAGVNLYVSELKVDLAHAQARAARAEGALQGIQDGLRRFAYAPMPQEPSMAEPAPATAPEAASEAPTAVPVMAAPILVADSTPPVAQRPEILISPPDDGAPIPTFLTELREVPLDPRGTDHALARLATMLNSTRVPAHAGA